MEYKITVERLVQREEERYPAKETVYEQVVSEVNLDLEAIIRAVNNIDYGAAK